MINSWNNLIKFYSMTKMKLISKQKQTKKKKSIHFNLQINRLKEIVKKQISNQINKICYLVLIKFLRNHFLKTQLANTVTKIAF